jgi:hypothetical protein
MSLTTPLSGHAETDEWLGVRPSSRTSRRREFRMCLTCGCGEPNDDHGDSRNITFDNLKAAAQAAEVTVDEAVKNFDETVKKAS